MSEPRTSSPESIECPLCLGKGELRRTEVLERLGMKDFARVAQLSAEEAIRMLLKNEKDSEQARWTKFETELTKRTAEVTDKHNAEVQKIQTEKTELSLRLKELEKSSAVSLDNAKQQERLTSEREAQKQLDSLNKRIAELEAAQKLADEQKLSALGALKTELEAALNIERAKSNDLDRRVQTYLAELDKVRQRNQELEAEMAKVARVGKKEELEFADEARMWPRMWISEKLPRNGDYLLAFRDAAGNALEPKMVVDNKDKESSITEGDVRKLIRDAKERHSPVAVIVTKTDGQLRQLDRDCRWAQEDGVWLLRSTREWLPRDLEVLKPVFERMREEGPDFLQKNSALADEVRRTFVDIDDLEKELKKAGTAIEKAKTLTVNYRTRLTTLCDGTASEHKMPAAPESLKAKSAASGAGY